MRRPRSVVAPSLRVAVITKLCWVVTGLVADGVTVTVNDTHDFVAVAGAEVDRVGRGGRVDVRERRRHAADSDGCGRQPETWIVPVPAIGEVTVTVHVPFVGQRRAGARAGVDHADGARPCEADGTVGKRLEGARLRGVLRRHDEGVWLAGEIGRARRDAEPEADPGLRSRGISAPDTRVHPGRHRDERGRPVEASSNAP